MARDPPNEYPRFLIPGMDLFNPVELAKKTEEIACRPGPQGQERKYTSFYVAGVYGGISTGYVVGCCLRCPYCWVEWARDYPERYVKFYSPKMAFERIMSAARRKRTVKARISGGEPTIGRKHLIEVLELVDESDISLFILETNGILLGRYEDYVDEISRFRKVHVRLSLKAGNERGFQRTGASPSAFELPYRGIRNLLDRGVSFHVAAMTDSRIMSGEEREELISRLVEIDPRLTSNLEEEIVDPYRRAVDRLGRAGIDLDWSRSRRRR